MTAREQRVLAVLVACPDREYRTAELVDACGIGMVEIAKVLSLLRAAGLVSSRWSGAPGGRSHKVHRAVVEIAK